MQIRWKEGFQDLEEWMYTLCLESVLYLIFIFNIYHYVFQKRVYEIEPVTVNQNGAMGLLNNLRPKNLHTGNGIELL